MVRLRRLLFRLFVPANRWIYERTGGKVGGTLAGAPVLLLSTTGRKTGTRRTTPVLYLADGDQLVVVASAGGSPTHPAWFLNLEADPDAEVQIGREVRPVRARITAGADRTALWRSLVAMYPSYASYQRETEREIPVIALSPRPRAA